MNFFKSLMTRLSALSLCLLLVAAGPVVSARGAGLSDIVTPELPAAQVYLGTDDYAQPMGLLPEGTPVTVLGIEDRYFRIDCYGDVGYILRTLVEWDSHVGSYMVRCADEPEEAQYLKTRSVAHLERIRSDLLSLAMDQQGTPYVYGGSSAYGFDCSGFLYYVYQNTGVDIGRSASPQLAQSMIVDPAHLQSGDLLFFFNTDGSDDFMTHVGMYIGGGQFIHSGSSTGVAIRDLTTGYYAEHFQCARRLLIPGVPRMAPMPRLALN